MSALQDIAAVAGGNKPLVVSIDNYSLVLLGLAVFIAMLLAALVAGFIIT